MKSPWETAAAGREFSEQTALFQWANMAKSFGLLAASYPESYKEAGFAKAKLGTLRGPDLVPQLKWLHAIKNQGHGDKVRGMRSAMEGVKPGVSDVFLPVSRVWPFTYGFDAGKFVLPGSYGAFGPDGTTWHAHHGLYIELKREGGKASPVQLEFQQDMRVKGYACEVCVGWEAARDLLLNYLGIA